MNTIDKLLEIEQSVVGKSYLNFKNNVDDKLFTILSLSLSLYFSAHSFMQETVVKALCCHQKVHHENIEN